MNNYHFNQIRRADCSMLKKTAMFLLGSLAPRRLEEKWETHARHMQAMLDYDYARKS